VWLVPSYNKIDRPTQTTQLISIPFKFCLLNLKYKKSVTRNASLLPAPKMRLVYGRRCPDPLGELTALPRSPSWIKGEGKEREEGSWKGEEREEGNERKGSDKKERGKTFPKSEVH